MARFIIVRKNTETKQQRENRLRPKLLELTPTKAPDTEWLIGDAREHWTFDGFACRFSYRLTRERALNMLRAHIKAEAA